MSFSISSGALEMVAYLILTDIFQTPSGQSPTEFLTIETLFTAAGATTAVFTVTSVFRALVPRLSPRWFAAFLSLFLTIVGIGVNHQPYRPLTILLAFINAAIVYTAAVGVNNITTAPEPQGRAAVEASGQSYRWWQ
jgi:hypothetical protein